MKRVLILVEGQTEETFIRDILGPHLTNYGIFPTPIIISTKRTKSGNKFKGGVVEYNKVKSEVLKLLGDSNASAVTTMIDYYGLPTDFPGYEALPSGGCYERVEFLEAEFSQNIDHQKFIPFIVLHEFEALLFVDTDQIASTFPGQVTVAQNLAKIKSLFNSPEEINDGPTTHPSARILAHTRGYQKPLHGSIIAKNIGIRHIREACPHFNSWLKRLEDL
jgi:hypothetical protein